MGLYLAKPQHYQSVLCRFYQSACHHKPQSLVGTSPLTPHFPIFAFPCFLFQWEDIFVISSRIILTTRLQIFVPPLMADWALELTGKTYLKQGSITRSPVKANSDMRALLHLSFQLSIFVN